MSLSPNLEKGLIELVVAAFFGGWFLVSLKTGEVYLNPVGRFSKAQSPPTFWAVCAVKLFFMAVCALAAVRLILHR
jgi:hypothetical protein